MNKYLGSSYNPTKISATIKNIIPLIVILIAIFGFNITEIEINELADVVIQGVIAIGLVWTSIGTAFGLVRKLLVKTGVIKPKVDG